MIKDKLKEVRERTGMNKKEFDEYIGIKYTTYNNYETGAREPDSEFLIMFSKKFNVSTDFILGLQEDKEILYSYELKASEFEHIEKYRSLDPHGQQTVDYILDRELARSGQLRQSQERITELEAQVSMPDNIVSIAKESSPDYLTPNAAHADDYAHAPENLKQLEEDIMDDENF